MSKITTFIGWALLAFFCMQAFRLFLTAEEKFLFLFFGGIAAIFLYHQHKKIEELENTISSIDEAIISSS